MDALLQEEAPTLCGNCLDEDGSLVQNIIDEQNEVEAQAHAALAELQVASATDSDATPDATPETGYSSELVLKDIRLADLWVGNGSNSYQATPYVGTIEEPGFNPWGYLCYVQMHRMPNFFARVVSGHRDESGKYYARIELPRSKDQEAEYLDIHVGDVHPLSPKYAQKLSPQSVDDRTIFSSLAKVEGYDAARDNAYLNAYKLAPFASFENIVKSGNAMAEDSALATRTISEQWPVHKDQGMKVSMLEGEAKDVVRSVVYYSDGTFEVFDLSYSGSRNLVASYVMNDNGVLYQPGFWLLGEGAQAGIDYIANSIRSKTWNSYFKPFDSRTTFHHTIRDHFDVNMHDHAEEVAANLISSIPQLNATVTSHSVWTSMMRMIENTEPTNNAYSPKAEYSLKSLLFMYAYYERFFSFDYGGGDDVGFQKNANPFLIMAFRGSVVRPGLSLYAMTADMLSAKMYSWADIERFNSNVFMSGIGGRTGANNVVELLQRLVTRTTTYTDMNDWFADVMHSIAFYEEYEPLLAEDDPNRGKVIWRGWDQAKRTPDLLPF